MKYTLLDNKSVVDVKKRINKHIVITTIAVALAVVLNIVLCLTRTDDTHIVFLVINIIVDLFVAWFTVFFTDNVIAPERKLYKLYGRLDYGEKLNCTVESVSEERTRVCGIPCRAVEGADGRRFFVIENAVEIGRGFVGTFTLVDNIAVEVTDE